MERRNIIIIGVAVLLGLLAVFLANSWFSGVEQRQERIAREQELERIAVARIPLEFGAPLTRDNVRLVNWPRQSVPAGAYRDVDQLLAGNNVTIRPIAEGEPILRERISERAVLSANLPADMRAVTVPVNAVTGVAGFITPGDVVDVLLTRQIPGDGAGGDDKMTNVLLENIQVLAIDRRSSEKSTEAKLAKTATLQVDQIGAQKIALATEVGTLSLALRNVQNQMVGASGTVTLSDLGGRGLYIRDRTPRPAAAPVYASAPASPPPVQRAAPVPMPAQHAPSGPSMTIFRGTERTNTEVQRYGRY